MENKGKPVTAPPILTSLDKMPPPSDPNSTQEQKLYQAVIESGNTVLSRRALNELNAVKSKSADLFRSAVVFRNTLFIFECHNIRLPIRQRIIDMFDKKVMRQIVLDEGSSEEESTADEDGRGGSGQDAGKAEREADVVRRPRFHSR